MTADLLNSIARHPLTPPGVLEAFARNVNPRSLWSPRSMGLALCLNPNLPRTALDGLLEMARHPVWERVMHRPGLTAADAVGLLHDVDHPGPWIAALTNVADPDDLLASGALDACPASSVAATVLRRAATIPIRHRAALRLAAHPRLNDDLDRRLLDAYITDYPAQVPQLLTVAVDEALVAQLHAAVQPGAPAPQDVLTRARRQGNGVAGLAHTPDPDRTLHAAALANAGTSPQRVSEVLNSLRTAPSERMVAIERLLALPDTRAHLTKAARLAVNRAVQSGPVDVACAFLRHSATRVDPRPVRDRTDLPADALEDIFRVVDFTAPDSRALWWAGWLAIYPGATGEQRARACALLASQLDSYAPASARAARAFDRVLTHITALAGGGASVADLEVKLTEELSDFAGGQVLLDTYLAGVLPELPTTAGPALLAMTPTFPGTIRELFTTIGAVLG